MIKYIHILRVSRELLKRRAGNGNAGTSFGGSRSFKWVKVNLANPPKGDAPPTKEIGVKGKRRREKRMRDQKHRPFRLLLLKMYAGAYPGASHWKVNASVNPFTKSLKQCQRGMDPGRNNCERGS